MNLKTTIESLVATAYAKAREDGTQYGVRFAANGISGYVSHYDSNPHGSPEITSLAVVWVADSDFNQRRCLDHLSYWIFMESVRAEYDTDFESAFAKLAAQAAEDERLSSIDATTLPGRLGRAAAAKANLYREEARYWSRLDRKVEEWASNHAAVGRGRLAREVASLASSKCGTSMFDFDATVPSWRICYDPSKEGA